MSMTEASASASGSSAHREALCAWASGYRRAWFAGEITELDPFSGGTAQARCTGYRARLVDARVSFWEFVRHRGAFPAS